MIRTELAELSTLQVDASAQGNVTQNLMVPKITDRSTRGDEHKPDYTWCLAVPPGVLVSTSTLTKELKPVWEASRCISIISG